MAFYGRWAPYVPVAQRRSNGKRQVQARMKKGESPQPINIPGRKIATTFWGQAWCDHFEQYRDYSNRLPRGRTYARNGSIADLRITSGTIKAMVCGSSLYDIVIEIKPLSKKKWNAICHDCGTSVHSLIDLMRGKLSDDVIRRMTDPAEGMFPIGREMSLSCDCPDYSKLCKHLAAVLYGVGHRLDTSPDLLFKLRGVDQNELIARAIANGSTGDAVGLEHQSELDGEDLGALFGIEMTEVSATPAKKKAARKTTKKASKKNIKTTQKKVAKKKQNRKKSSGSASDQFKGIKIILG